MPTHPELIKNGALVVNGARVPILSGEIQFFRMPPETWDTALEGLKAAGLPMVSTYLSWRRFSLGRDRYDLDGRTDPRLDVRRFLDLCRKHGLLVTMKPGPWICAEEANGGYPDWLVEMKDLQVLDAAGNPVQGYNPSFRSPIPSYLHPMYLDAVGTWFREVDKVIKPYAYPQGPIILVQVDNEPSMTFHDTLLESDYNPINVGEDGLYNRWLKEKYRTIADLNR
ncbi:MAG TPA: beta-galactosidase, partial [Spirochaetia bacterium]|nr:beta-galactosidase [Spirochaetia bacterium]